MGYSNHSDFSKSELVGFGIALVLLSLWGLALYNWSLTSPPPQPVTCYCSDGTSNCMSR